MPTARECICCKDIPVIEQKLKELELDPESSIVACLTEHEAFTAVCLNRWVLQTAGYQTRQQYGSETTDGPPHKYV